MYEEGISRRSNWCQNILLPITNQRKLEKTVDSSDKKGFEEEVLYIKFNQGLLEAF